MTPSPVVLPALISAMIILSLLVAAVFVPILGHGAFDSETKDALES